MLHVDESYAETLSTARDGDCFGAGDVILSKMVKRKVLEPALQIPGGRMFQAIHIVAINGMTFWTDTLDACRRAGKRGAGPREEGQAATKSEEPCQAGI